MSDTQLRVTGPTGVAVCFSTSFTIGRSKSVDFVVNDPAVSRQHVRVEFDGERWWIEDVQSGNGAFLNGARISRAEVVDGAVIELGQGGPQVVLTVLAPVQATVASPPEAEPDEPIVETVHLGPETKRVAPNLSSETQVIRHFLEKPEGDAGEQTMMFRRALTVPSFSASTVPAPWLHPLSRRRHPRRRRDRIDDRR